MDDINYKDSIGIYPYSLGLRPMKDFMFEDFPSSGIPLEKNKWNEGFKKSNDHTLEKEINSYGFRCDEFKKNHNGKHILFLGCSYTWGTGLYFNETWSKKVYDNIAKNEATSGYYNLGCPGDSIYMQITYAFKYFKNFGNPDVIFFNIPDFTRFYAYSNKVKSIVLSIVEKNNTGILSLLAYQYYYMLEQYCISNGIKLFSFTWAYSENEDRSDIKESQIEKFDTFYSINLSDVANHILEYRHKNKSDQNALIARDGLHLGTSYHDYWANFIYNKYMEKQ